MLDPNGEYSRAFGSSDPSIQARIFKVDPSGSETALKVPLWFWNSAEWGSFTQASARTQRPLLRRALREVKAGRIATSESTEGEKKLELRRYLSSRLISVQGDLRSGSIQTDESRFGFRLRAIASDLAIKKVEFPSSHLAEIHEAICQALQATHNSFTRDGKIIEYYRAFTESQVNMIIDAFKIAIETLGGLVYQEGPNEDIPLPFKGTDLADHLEILTNQENVISIWTSLFHVFAPSYRNQT